MERKKVLAEAIGLEPAWRVDIPDGAFDNLGRIGEAYVQIDFEARAIRVADGSLPRRNRPAGLWQFRVGRVHAGDVRAWSEERLGFLEEMRPHVLAGEDEADEDLLDIQFLDDQISGKIRDVYTPKDAIDAFVDANGTAEAYRILMTFGVGELLGSRKGRFILGTEEDLSAAVLDFVTGYIRLFHSDTVAEVSPVPEELLVTMRLLGEATTGFDLVFKDDLDLSMVHDEALTLRLTEPPFRSEAGELVYRRFVP